MLQGAKCVAVPQQQRSSPLTGAVPGSVIWWSWFRLHKPLAFPQISSVPAISATKRSAFKTRMNYRTVRKLGSWLNSTSVWSASVGSSRQPLNNSNRTWFCLPYPSSLPFIQLEPDEVNPSAWPWKDFRAQGLGSVFSPYGM